MNYAQYQYVVSATRPNFHGRSSSRIRPRSRALGRYRNPLRYARACGDFDGNPQHFPVRSPPPGPKRNIPIPFWCAGGRNSRCELSDSRLNRSRLLAGPSALDAAMKSNSGARGRYGDQTVGLTMDPNSWPLNRNDLLKIVP